MVASHKSEALGNLKACITLLVVLHHSVLAYCRFGHFDNAHYLWSTAPIVDPDRWVGFDILVAFNDIWFMPLMFLLSGLFVLPSLVRRGANEYLLNRAVRLGLPFLAAVVVIMPVAYYPSYLQTGANISFADYYLGYFTSTGWASGPAWFIWVLLFLDIVAVSVSVLYRGLPRSTAQLPDWIVRRPLAGAGIFLALVGLAYLPPLLMFGGVRWFAWGPFAVQASRVLLYPLFFAAGIVMGSAGIAHTLFSRTGPFARAWPVCTVLTLIAFASLVGLRIVGSPETAAALAVLVCVLSGIAMIGLFVRYMDHKRRWLEALAPCAFGIYLLHYAPVTWSQTALMSINLSPILKGILVFGFSLGASWFVVSQLRRVTALRRIL